MAANGKGKSVNGTKGDDAIVGTDRRENISAKSGNDTVQAGGGNDKVSGGRGNDSIDGGAGNDRLHGNTGDDTLSGGAGNDRLDGNPGDDLLDGGAGNDRVDGKSGNDAATYVMGENAGATDSYDGGSGIDTLRLEFTRDEWMQDDVQADIAAYLQFLAQHIDPDSGQADGERFHFSAFDLTARKFENLVVVVDGVELDPRDEAVDAVDDTATIEENETLLTGSVLGNDVVPDLIRAVTLVSGPSAGTLTFGSTPVGQLYNPATDGLFSFDPGTEFDYLAVGEQTSVTFVYQVEDADHDTDTATVTIAITGTNDAPVIALGGDEAGAVEEDATLAVTGQLAASDVDNGAVLSWSVSGGGAGAYGSLAVDGTGQWTYTLDNAAANVQALAAGESHVESFTVVVTDEHGATDTRQVDVTVTGTNDAPVVAAGGDDAGVVEEDATLAVTGQLTASDVDNGATQAWSVAGGGVGVYGALAVDGTGQWTYTLDNGAANVQALAAGESHVETFDVVVTDEHGATDTRQVSVTVTGTNDSPVVADADVTGSITELSGSALATLSGTLTADNSFSVYLSGADNVTGTLLTSGGDWGTAYGFASASLMPGVTNYIHVVAHNAGGPGGFLGQFSLGGSGFTFPNGLTTEYTAPGDWQVSLSGFGAGYTTPVSEGFNGVSPWGHSNPEISASASWLWNYYSSASSDFNTEYFSMAITPAALTDSGTIAFTDVDLTDTHAIAPTITASAGALGTLTAAVVADTTGSGLGGVIAWNYSVADALVDYLAAGETRVESFTIVLDDGNGGTVDRTVDVTITGTNDAPVIGVADVAGAVTEIADNAAGENAAMLSDTGIVAFTDIDLADEHEVSVAPQGASYRGTLVAGVSDASAGDGVGAVTWTFSVADSALDDLAAGEVLTQSYDVTVDDGHGGTATETVTVTIAGTNDGPVVTAGGDDVGSTQEDSVLAATGQLTATDVDNGATQAWSVAGGGAGAYGSLAVDSTGLWTYTLANGNTNVQALAAGESHVESFTVVVTDEHGTTDTQLVEVTVAGTNDAPVVMAGGDDTGVVEEDVTLAVTGQLSATDVDDGATQAWSVAGGGAGTYGSLAVDGTGLWTYTLDNAAANVQALAAGESHVESFTVVVTDEHGATDTQVVEVTVAGTNDAPVAVDDVVGEGDTVVLGFDGTTWANVPTGYGGFDWLSSGSHYYGSADIQFYSSNIFNAWAGQNSTFNWLGDGDVDVQGLSIWNWSEVYQVRFDGYDDGVLTDSLVVGVGGSPAWVALDFDSIDRLDVVVTGGTGNGNGITGTGWWFLDSFTFNESASDVNEDAALTIAAADLLANDTDVDNGAVLSVAGVSATSTLGAVVSLDVGGDVDYDPTAADGLQALAEGETATDTFTYTVEDEHGATDTATVSVTVTGVNDAPVVVGGDVAGAVQEDATLAATGQLTATDVDNGASLSWSVAGAAAGAYGALAVDASGQWTYTLDNAAADVQALAAGESHVESFTVVVTDEHGASDTQVVEVTVTGTNDAPAAGDIHVYTNITPEGGGETGVPIPDPGDGRLIDGLGGTAGFGENAVLRNDDGNSGFIDLSGVFGSGLNFFGTTYTGLYINTNGNVSFGSGVSQFTPSQIGAGIPWPLIAPFWADVDTNGGVASATPGGTSTGENLVWYDLDATNGVFTATWDDVGYYSGATSPLNAFQLQLFDRGSGDFDIVFRYEDINWTAGDASGGSGGLGGTPARAGYSAGNGVDFFELPASGDQTAMLDLENAAGNFGDGIWAFQVRDGGVSELTAQFEYGISDFAGASDTGTVFVHSQDGTTIQGGATDDILISASTNDILTGGAGDDIFVFRSGGGQDTVSDFGNGADVLDFADVMGFDDFADVQGAMSQSGADTVVNLGGGDQLTLLGVDMTTLHNDDFMF